VLWQEGAPAGAAAQAARAAAAKVHAAQGYRS